MMLKKKSNAGFTLLEVMIAVAILAISLLSLYVGQSNSLRKSAYAEDMRTASFLGQQKLIEKRLELQHELDKGAFPEDKTEESGEFEKPFERFRWEWKIRKVEIPPSLGDSILALLSQFADAEQEKKESNVENPNQPSESIQQQVLQVVLKKINESLRQIDVVILWEELGETQSIKISTHLTKL